MNDKTKTLLDRAPEIVAAVLCDKTMECCGKAKQCPYHSTDYNHISIGYGCDVDRLHADTAGLLKAYAAQLAAVTAERDALDDALRDMVGQYCSYDGRLDHEFMSAGEHAFDVLDLDYGALVETLWRGPQGAGEAAHE